MKATAKVAAVAAGLALATSMLSLAPIAHAACSVGTANLTVGSSGAAVTCLQQGLIAGGYSIPAGATGHFGAQTQAAVKAWQTANGISPAAGFFGPISRAAFSGNSSASATGVTNSSVAGCASGALFSATTGQSCTAVSTVPGCTAGAAFSATTGQSCTATVTTYPAGCVSSVGFSSTTGMACSSGTTTTTTGGMSGSGRFTNISSYGSVYSDIKEGDAATAVVGVQADATGGDVAIQRVDASFYVDDVSSQSSNLNQYVSDVSVYLGSTKLASMDPALGDKSGRIWTMRFSGLNGVVKQGTTGNIVVKVTPLTSIGTNEDGKSITAALLANSVRAVGADGISDTYVAGATVVQNSGTADTVTGVAGQRFTISSATTGTLTVTAAGDNPTASQIAVSSSTTTGVKLLSFNMKAKNADVKVTDLVASFGTNDSLSDVVNTVYLMKGSAVLKSTTLSSGTYGTVTFSNVNDTITKDATNNYTLVADLKGDSAYGDGTTLVASTTVSGWDVSDANGSSVTPSAAAVGNTQTLTATGISVTRGTPSTSVAAGLTGAGDIATMIIPFTVTAGDSDIYIGGAANNATGNTAGKVNYATTTTSTQGATAQPTANLSVGSTVTGDSAGVYYKVGAGTSRTFTLTVVTSASTSGVTAGFVGAQIGSIAYGTVAGTEASYYTSNLDTFKTSDVYVTKR